MSENQNLKEVYFHEYCKNCKHESIEDYEEPCDECLSEPCNIDTHKPVKFEEDK